MNQTIAATTEQFVDDNDKSLSSLKTRVGLT